MARKTAGQPGSGITKAVKTVLEDIQKLEDDDFLEYLRDNKLEGPVFRACQLRIDRIQNRSKKDTAEAILLRSKPDARSTGYHF